MSATLRLEITDPFANPMIQHEAKGTPAIRVSRNSMGSEEYRIIENIFNP